MDSLTLPPPGIHMLTTNLHCLQTVLESIADIHASCILRDHTMASFIPPLSRPEMIQHWQDLANDSNRIILISISNVSDRTHPDTIPSPFPDHPWLTLLSNLSSTPTEISGVISLSTPPSQTGPFRGLVQKVFISPHHRRRGLATQLLAELEKQALARGTWSLMLDTTVGTPAERMYHRLGYRVLGVVEEYGYTPKDRTLVDEIFFWKDLRNMERD